jgi:hypothetical protein
MTGRFVTMVRVNGPVGDDGDAVTMGSALDHARFRAGRVFRPDRILESPVRPRDIVPGDGGRASVWWVGARSGMRKIKT